MARPCGGDGSAWPLVFSAQCSRNDQTSPGVVPGVRMGLSLVEWLATGSMAENSNLYVKIISLQLQMKTTVWMWFPDALPFSVYPFHSVNFRRSASIRRTSKPYVFFGWCRFSSTFSCICFWMAAASVNECWGDEKWLAQPRCLWAMSCHFAWTMSAQCWPGEADGEP